MRGISGKGSLKEEICLTCWGHNRNAPMADVEYAEIREAMEGGFSCEDLAFALRGRKKIH